MWSILLSFIGLVSFVGVLKLSERKTKTSNSFKYLLTAVSIVSTSLFFVSLLSPDVSCESVLQERHGIFPMIYIGGLAILDYYLFSKYQCFNVIKAIFANLAIVKKRQ